MFGKLGRLFFGVAGLACLLFVIADHSNVPAANAANASDWDAGYIISDSNLYNADAMSVAEIQAFLEQKVSGACGNSNCLKNYRQTTATVTLSFGTCSTYQGAANESAAQILYKVQQACGISAKALLVILQKEQSLITSSSPSSSQMQSALGNACPDTGPCDPAYSGFFMQMYSGARQLAWYGNPNSSFTAIRPGTFQSIQYNPNTACGSSQVFIRNKATAALYYYTPYQPNAAALANLEGIGDGCSAYGNRNFWRIYTEWFGNPQGYAHMSFDSAQGVWGGINISGWAKTDNGTADTKFLWVNVDGSGRAIAAAQPLGWFNIKFPGLGPNHGFSEFFSASPGSHSVCAYYTTSSNQTISDCKYVDVPGGFGSFDSASGTKGGVRIAGWSADATKTGTAPSFLWVTVNGNAGSAMATNRVAGWLPGMFPGTSTGQGFDLIVPTGSGSQVVCVYGAYAQGTSKLYGCKTATVPLGQGSLDSVTAGGGGINLSGWYVDFTRASDSFVWIDVDGRGAAYLTNTNRSWLPGLIPNASISNGFDYFLPAETGQHTVCVYGANSGMKLGCSTVNVPYSAAGSIDSITTTNGGIQLSGWAADLKTSSPAYVWINVNGQGGAVYANQSTPWFEAIWPGRGNSHGFNATIPAAAGTNNVCIYVNSISVSCKSIVVTAGTGSLDSVTATNGGVRFTGWYVDFTRRDSSYIWVEVDGRGQARGTNTALPWLAGYLPGYGINQGFDYTLPVDSPGNHTICVKAANSGALLGCKTVTVASIGTGSFDSATGGSGFIDVSGWAVDFRSANPTFAWINVDGAGGAIYANTDRPWFDTMFPGYGNNHGFDARIPASPGVHNVCAYTGQLSLGCKQVSVY